MKLENGHSDGIHSPIRSAITERKEGILALRITFRRILIFRGEISLCSLSLTNREIVTGIREIFLSLCLCCSFISQSSRNQSRGNGRSAQLSLNIRRKKKKKKSPNCQMPRNRLNLIYLNPSLPQFLKELSWRERKRKAELFYLSLDVECRTSKVTLLGD